MDREYPEGSACKEHSDFELMREAAQCENRECPEEEAYKEHSYEDEHRERPQVDAHRWCPRACSNIDGWPPEGRSRCLVVARHGVTAAGCPDYHLLSLNVYRVKYSSLAIAGLPIALVNRR